MTTNQHSQHRKSNQLSISLTQLLNSPQSIKQSRANFVLLPVILGGCLAFSNSSLTMAQSNIIPIPFDPPPIPSLDDRSDIPIIDFPPVETFPDVREYDFQSPSTTPSSITPVTPITPRSSLLGYRVDVDGSSELLLTQVRRVAPGAFYRPQDGVIQAGLFSDPVNAQRRVQELEFQGIRSRVVSVDTTTTALNPSFQTPIPSDVDRQLNNRGYFVAIPSNTGELPAIANQVRLSGVESFLIQQRLSPRGPHIAVGPFERRSDAERWNNQFRSQGMDARLYFDR